MRAPRLIFLCLGLFLVLFPLSVARPGVPVTLKADEPAYFGMALSLIEDGDLRCERGDVRRLADRFPYLPIENLILMSDDGWRTIYYGKPYLYSLLAAPAVALADHRGMVAFNMVLLLAVCWMGAVYLRRFNEEWLAVTFSLAFFLLSGAFIYVFWLQPEVLNLFAVAACLHLAFHDPRPAGDVDGAAGRLSRALARPVVRAALSGTVLTVAVYHKPMLAILGVPALWVFLRRHGVRPALAWLAGAAVSMAAVMALSVAVTGEPIAYLGADRLGIKIEDPERFDQMTASLSSLSRYVIEQEENVGHEKANTFAWVFRIPEVYPRMLIENVGYFLWGRHTGVLFYLPFGVVAVLLFLLRTPRSVERWLLIVSSAGLAVFFLVWIHYNWHGGEGFVGNRYVVSAYPAFLYLVTAIRPAALVVPGFAAAGAFLAPLLFSPYGAPVPEPTLQAHARGAAWQALPIERSLQFRIPGYETMHAHGLSLTARQDLFRAIDPAHARFQVWGATTTDLWLAAAEPIESLTLEVSSPAPDNVVTIDASGTRAATLEFSADAAPRRIEVALGPGDTRFQYRKKLWVYRMSIGAATGRNPRHPDGQVVDPQFYVGADVTLLASRKAGP